MGHHQIIGIDRTMIIMADVHDDVAKAAELCPFTGFTKKPPIILSVGQYSMLMWFCTFTSATNK